MAAEIESATASVSNFQSSFDANKAELGQFIQAR